jgi:hypothetical protein
MLTLFTTTKKLILPLLLLIMGGEVYGQISITSLGAANTQNFNGLANSGTAQSPLSGWEMAEPPTYDDLYDAEDGSSSTAGIYSYGTGTNSDRAWGSLTASLTEPMIIGVKYTNNTAQNISSVTIQYSGEQWRLGQTSLSDKLIFEYSTDATSVTDNGATWIAVTSLDFTSPVTTGTIGALDGNSVANRTTLSANIAVNIPTTTGFIFIRWRDQQLGSNDHALAIDDLSLTAYANLTSGTYADLMVDGTMTLGGDITISGSTTFINGSSIVDIGSNTFTISGDIVGTPIIKGSANSNLVISGSGTIGTINFDQTTPGTTNLLKNVTINRSGATITLGNALNISDVDGSVNLTAGTLATGGNLTLLSSFSGTARIGTITSGVSDLTGNITAQRYMQGAALDYRGWRTMGPITSSFAVTQLTDDIFVTGPGGVSNGFDANGTNSSVMYYEEDFNASGGRGWKSISNTSAAFTAGQGMLVFFRGDRTQTASITNTSTVPNNVVVDVVGAINKGDVVVNLKYNDDGNGATEDGWNFISNPYPSQILWGNVSKGVSVDDNIAVLNPLTNGYVTLGLTDYIPSHQGFFVKSNAASQSITFQENDKVNNGNTPYFKTQTNPFTIKMFEDSVKYDIALLKFEATATKNYVFKEDALKMTNSRINLGYITPDGKTIQVNTIPNLSSNSTDTFILKTTSFKNGTHWLTFEDKAILPLTKNVILVDGYNNNIIDVKATSSYAFNINNTISGTYGNRFKLIITDQFSALPVKLSAFTGEKLGESNLLSWTSATEKNLINYQIEKSVDGKLFEPIGLVKATNTSTTTNYTFIDNNVGTATNNYYRLKINEQKGINSYSQVVAIKNNGALDVVFDVYPNPTQNTININLPENNHLKQALIFDVNGKLLLSTTSQNNINVSNLLPGVYTVQIVTETTEQKVKFIKH